MNTPLLQVCHLVKHFPVNTGSLLQFKATKNRAVDDVSFCIAQGETVGLVGESGSGKTTLGRTILRLVEPTSGAVYYRGEDILQYSKREMRLLRQEMQIIFQETYAALSPRMTAGAIIGEPLQIHSLARGEKKAARVQQLLDIVGLASYHLHRYPHEFSGGQRQRIGIARALAVNPKFIICDEPVSALDVSIQAQILNLLQDLQQEFGLTYLFISHDLAVVKHICDRVAVMYLGKILEIAPKIKLFTSASHPYTQALLSAIPTVKPVAARERIILCGDAPSSIDPPRGCRFHTRCPIAEPICCRETPQLMELTPGHWVACHLAAWQTATTTVVG